MMIIKKAFIAILILASLTLLGWLYLQYQNQQESIRLNQKLDMLSGKVELKVTPEKTEQATPQILESEPAITQPKAKPKFLIPEPKPATPVGLSDEQIAELKSKADKKQSQINELIVQLDQHLSDHAQKRQIQTKIDKLLKEYNELILPVALHAIAQQNEAKSG